VIAITIDFEYFILYRANI